MRPTASFDSSKFMFSRSISAIAILRLSAHCAFILLITSFFDDLSLFITLFNRAFLGDVTNIVSNNAAAVIGTPIAISVAAQLNLPPEPFILAVLFGANLSYATPMAYKTNLLVMNAGGYQFSDFVRVGIPLILLMWITLSFLLNWLYL